MNKKRITVSEVANHESEWSRSGPNSISRLVSFDSSHYLMKIEFYKGFRMGVDTRANLEIIVETNEGFDQMLNMVYAGDLEFFLPILYGRVTDHYNNCILDRPLTDADTLAKLANELFKD